MNHLRHTSSLLLAFLLGSALSAVAQTAYIGFVYPAGGQRGTTFQVTMGGQAVEGVNQVLVSGRGVTARVREYNKRMNPQEITLISEQLRELKSPPGGKGPDPRYTNMMARIERIIRDNVDQPACSAIANLIVADVTIAPDAELGTRELRVNTPRGVSNPMVFEVGELREYAGPPVPTSRLIILGKEGLSLRRKERGTNAPPPDMMMSAMMATTGPSGVPGGLDDDVEAIELPCTVNGQITSGTVDRYRFRARKGQTLVLAARARELVPYMADAVPGWFQPVIALWDAQGREVAYRDDYRFKPDPVVVYDVPQDGEYLFAIHDAIYRGREDFVYRVRIGELPFVTSTFPLGGPTGAVAHVRATGVNLAQHEVEVPARAEAGRVALTAAGRTGFHSNEQPFEICALPEVFEREGNDTARKAQRIVLPVVVNGQIGKPGDADVFEFSGRAGETVVAEVTARRLDSPLDSVLKLTDADGHTLALNDDREDAAAGINTHHADSYLRVTLPADGLYRVRIADTQHNGGGDYAYRLRVSHPVEDFALRVVPSSFVVRSNAPAYPAVHLLRMDGFAGPVTVRLQDPPPGITMRPVTFTGTQTMVRVEVKTSIDATNGPLRLAMVGTATNTPGGVTRCAVPAEDRMQAFLWRQLVPAEEWMGMVLPVPPKVATTAPAQPAPARPAQPSPAPATPPAKTTAVDAKASKPAG